MDRKNRAMISDAALAHLRKRFDGFTTLSDLRRYWEQDIGKHAAKDKRVIAMKEQRKKELSE